MNLTLANPLALLLLPLALWLVWRRRSRAALPLPLAPDEPEPPRSWRARLLWVPTGLRLLALTCAVLALARPQGERTEMREEAEGIAIQMVVDLSTSMLADLEFRDGQTTRLEAARTVLRDFILGNDGGLTGREGDLIGLVTFARYAEVLSPLTLNHRAVAEIARHLDVPSHPNEDGTAYGDAIALAAAHLQRLDRPGANPSALTNGEPTGDDEPGRIIILLTDGENNAGRHLPSEAAAIAKAWGIRIYTIALGFDVRVEYATDAEGNRVIVPRRPTGPERVLREIAEMTGGIHRHANDFESLESVYAEIDRLERRPVRTVAVRQTAEWFGPFALVALIALVAEAILRATWLRMFP